MRILLIENDKVPARRSRAPDQSAHAVHAAVTGEEAGRVLALAMVGTPWIS